MSQCGADWKACPAFYRTGARLIPYASCSKHNATEISDQLPIRHSRAGVCASTLRHRSRRWRLTHVLCATRRSKPADFKTPAEDRPTRSSVDAHAPSRECRARPVFVSDTQSCGVRATEQGNGPLAQPLVGVLRVRANPTTNKTHMGLSCQPSGSFLCTPIRPPSWLEAALRSPL
jgi:hypothetical protein